MTLSEIAKLRMVNQGIRDPGFRSPQEVVKHLGAMQAQDYLGALWAIGLRLSKPTTQNEVEKALLKGNIIRGWPMRGTLHFLTNPDARWMFELLLPRSLSVIVPRGEKRYGLDSRTISRIKEVIVKALANGNYLSRPEIYKIFEKAKIATGDSRGLHILGRLAHEQVICFGPRKGKQQTFVLFDHWVPASKKISRDQALKEIVVRYFTSHGPAQIQDLGWWSGLMIKDIKKGIELADKELHKEEVEGKLYYMAERQPKVKDSDEAYLLPPFDEFMVAYRDRSASLESVHAHHINPGANGVLAPIIVINGQILGTWRRKITRKGIEVTTHPFTKFTTREAESINRAIEKYKKFLRPAY